MTEKIEEIIERDGFVLEMTVGNSMEPMLKNRQNPIVIGKLTRKPKKNDVVLFKRDTGEYVLHRIVKVYKDGYYIRGDNRAGGDREITDRHFVGILLGYYDGDRYIDCETDENYKRYVSRLKYRAIYKKMAYLFAKTFCKNKPLYKD